MTRRPLFLLVALSALGGTAIAVPAAASPTGRHTAVAMSVQRQARHSWTQLTALELKIAQAGQYWQRHGVLLGQWEANPSADKVVVQLRSFSSSAKRQLLRRYGASWVYVSPVPDRQRLTLAGGHTGLSPETDRRRVTPDDRYTDFSPFLGGDMLFYNTHTPSTFCTAGFAVTDKKKQRFMLTAGHCVIAVGIRI
jgi:hypothetical protein